MPSTLFLTRRGQCPFCLFEVARDPGHLARCLYEYADQILFGPVTVLAQA